MKAIMCVLILASALMLTYSAFYLLHAINEEYSNSSLTTSHTVYAILMCVTLVVLLTIDNTGSILLCVIFISWVYSYLSNTDNITYL